MPLPKRKTAILQICGKVSHYTKRLILRDPGESDVPKLKAFDDRNAHRLTPWRSTEPGVKLDYLSQVMKWKQEFEDGRAIRFLLISREDSEGEMIGFCKILVSLLRAKPRTTY